MLPSFFALPTIYPNGTPAKALSSEYHAFDRALSRAYEALQEATCSARDFYPQGDAAWQQARSERAKMFSNLDELQSYASMWAERADGRI